MKISLSYGRFPVYYEFTWCMLLMEHQPFADLLRAAFHVLEELSSRDNLTNLPESDKAHLAGDIKRAYNFLINEWLDYMKYLKKLPVSLFARHENQPL